VQWINGSLTCYARKNGGRCEPIPCNEKTISNEEGTMPISDTILKNFTGSPVRKKARLSKDEAGLEAERSVEKAEVQS
jgi:hypothetical protein